MKRVRCRGFEGNVISLQTWINQDETTGRVGMVADLELDINGTTVCLECVTPDEIEEINGIQEKRMNEKIIQAIESILNNGDRVELIPGPNHEIKVIHIKRKKVDIARP